MAGKLKKRKGQDERAGKSPAVGGRPFPNWEGVEGPRAAHLLKLDDGPTRTLDGTSIVGVLMRSWKALGPRTTKQLWRGRNANNNPRLATFKPVACSAFRSG